MASFPLRSLADQASDAISVQQRDRELLDDVRTLFGRRVGGPYDKTGSRTGGSDRSFTWWATGPRGRGIARTPFYLLSTRRQAQVGMFLRISREQAPPKVDPEDPARSLWDAAPEDELE